MANQEHLAFFVQGSTVWNRWRQAHPEIQPDLSESTFVLFNFREASLRGANLKGAQLGSTGGANGQHGMI